MATQRSIVVYYEHPDWFRPLFAELERRDIPHVKVDASLHRFDPVAGIESVRRSGRHPRARTQSRHADGNGTNGARPASLAGAGLASDAPEEQGALVFNRMSPSAWKRGRGNAILYTLHYLRHLEHAGIPVVNGFSAFSVETSKALQLSLIRRLGLRAPRTRVVNHPAALPQAAEGLAYPLVVKPNIGGSGAGIVRFDGQQDLEVAVETESIPPSIDGILLLQEFHPPIGDSIVRVETLEGRYLYGIRVHLGEGAGFNLCPADICRDTSGAELSSPACPAGAAQAGLAVEAYDPPAEIRAEVERLARTSRLDVGGIEYLESRRDGWRYYYDINALSNFVADPVKVLGFDPTARLVDALVARASAPKPRARARREQGVGLVHPSTSAEGALVRRRP